MFFVLISGHLSSADLVYIQERGVHHIVDVSVHSLFVKEPTSV